MGAPRYFCSVGLIILAGLLCFFALHGCGNRRGLSKLKPCRLPGLDEELLCGKLTVFENRETRTGRMIDLNVVVLPAFDQKNKSEPLFDIEGGPGAAASNAAMFYAKEGKEYRRKHDVVLVHQRGTGESNRLTAPPIKKAPSTDLIFPCLVDRPGPRRVCADILCPLSHRISRHCRGRARPALDVE